MYSFATIFSLSLAAVSLTSASNIQPRSNDCNPDNPFKGKHQYPNPSYAEKLETTIAAFTENGDLDNANRAKTVQGFSIFSWIDSNAAISKFEDKLKIAVEQASNRKEKTIFPFVIYNIPDRDCSAKASAGELSVDKGGLDQYKQYIDDIAAIVTNAPYTELDYAVIIEPDAVGNMVTNIDIAKCNAAAEVYKDGIAYAIKKLGCHKNIWVYLDATHSNWLGQPKWVTKAAEAFIEIYKRSQIPIDNPSQPSDNTNTGPTLRGFATNVSNYYPFKAEEADIVYGDNPNWSELKYINALRPKLKAAGVPSQFLVDQGRSGGKKNLRPDGKFWCNLKGAGFGTPPTCQTGVCYVDAIIWGKPGGESDGTSDTKSSRYDTTCTSPYSFIPAPEAGQWNEKYVEMLIINATPPIEVNAGSG